MHYNWRIKGVTGKWHTTRWRTTEEEIRKSHPEAQRVEGTGIAREKPETELEKAVFELERGTAPFDDAMRAKHARLRAELDAQRSGGATSP